MPAARSVSLGILHLLWGPVREGVGLGRGYIAVGDLVLALTRPGWPRMPNGVECDLDVAPHASVEVGAGRIATERGWVCVDAPLWDPTPRVALRARRAPAPIPSQWLARLPGSGPGLTPAGDDLLAGYAAGLVLWHGRSDEAQAIAREAAPRTTLLAGTLLRHAARGQLPEPAHAFVQRGDLRALSRFGRTSGLAIALGLVRSF